MMKHSTIQIMLISLSLLMLMFIGVASAGNIKKSPNDKRLYKSVTLKNELQVLIISDPKSEMAAASLSVRAGLFDDPKTREGLAHFLEHMLFLGNKKYPEPGSFEKYLSAYGGHSNATTKDEETNYYFTVQDGYLNEALDRFSQFFISPSFYPDFVDREINAVHSEYQKSLKNDGNRIFQVIKETANPKHPINKFGMGNREALLDADGKSEKLYQELLSFYTNQYSANRMKLVVQGSESIVRLEKYVEQYFDKIKNKNLKINKITEPLFSAKLPRLISIKPLKQIRRLRLVFQVPSQLNFLKFKPEQVVSSLIGDEGPGSLLSYLKDKGWVTSLSSGSGMKTHDHNLFEIGIGLTNNGVKHVNDITEALFSYLEVIKREKNRQRYYNELAKLAEIEFQFQEKTEPIGYVKRLASNLQIIPAEDVLTIPWSYEKYRPDLENNFLQYLTPKYLQLVLIANDIKTDQIAKWYQTEYSVESIGEKDLKRWEHPKSVSKFKLPPTNPFIPDKIVLKDEKHGLVEPILLKHTPKIKIWFKHDNTFNIPKGNLRVLLTTPNAYITVKNAIKTKLFTKLLQENLNEYAYPAATAGLRYSLYGTTNGLILNMSGYAENMSLLLKKVLNEINHFNLDPSKFEIFKDQMLDQRKNQKKAPAYRRNMYENIYFLSESFWHFDEYIDEIPSITAPDVKSFVPELLKNLNIEIFAHGNFSLQEIKKTGQVIEESFKVKDAVVIHEIHEKTLKLETGQDLVYGFETSDINSAVQCYYQAGPKSHEQRAALEVISKLLEKPFYHQLRTIDQLGYLVSLSIYPINRVDGFVFLVQSGEKTPAFLQKRIDRFLKENTQIITKLTKTDLGKIIKTLVDEKQKPPKNLSEETRKFWNIITSKEYDFSIIKKEVAALQALNHEDIVNVFNRVFIDKKQVRKVSIQAWGKNNTALINKNNWIADIYQLKNAMDYYPNPAGKITSKTLDN